MSGDRIRPPSFTRRAVAAMLLEIGLGCLARAAAQGQPGEDRGIGGTGVAPADPTERLGQDRGIGGTGVIGTIRRFGSIVVNDLNVTFPPTVRVTIDDRPATSHDLRLGHVVEVLAHGRIGRLNTTDIAVRSEVVGPVDSIENDAVTVLGQRVVPEHGKVSTSRSIGEVVAVSGLRRPDGSVVASLVEPRPGAASRLRGPLRANKNGGLAIGTLRIAGLEPKLAGHRVSLVGERRDQVFEPATVEIEPAVPFATEADRLSLEAYVAASSDGLSLGSGLVLGGAKSASVPQSGEPVRAVVTATVDPQGRLHVLSVRVEHEPPDAERYTPRHEKTRKGAPDRAGSKNQPGGSSGRSSGSSDEGSPGRGGGSRSSPSR